MKYIPLDEQNPGKISKEYQKKNENAAKIALSITVDQKSTINTLFTLIWEITNLHIWHISFYFLQCILPVLQILGFHLWYNFIPFSESGQSIQAVVSILNMFLKMSKPNSAMNFNETTLKITIIVIYCFIFLSILLCFLIYQIRGKLPKAIIWFNAFMSMIFIYAFYFPMAMAFGISVDHLADGKTVDFVFFFVFLIIFGVSTVLLHLSAKTINHLTNPSQSLFQTINGTHSITFFIGTAIIIFCAQLTELIGSRFSIAVIVLSIIFNSYLIYDTFTYPFAKKFAHAFADGFYIYSIVGDIMGLLSYFNIDLGIIYIILPFVLGIIGIIALYFVHSKYVRTLASRVTLFDDNDETKFEEVINKADKGLFYIRAGYVSGSFSILNGDLPLYVARRFPSFKTWNMAASILAFLPGQHENFAEAYDALTSIITKNTIEKLLINRIVRINQIRTMESDESSAIFINARALTKDSSSAVRQFWSDIASGRKMQMADVMGVAAMLQDAQKNLNDDISSFPNDATFASLYAQFQIEALGNTERGVYWILKSGHLSSGCQNGIDPIFRCFAISRPELVKHRIVDKYGNVSATTIEGYTTVNISMTTKFDNAEDKLEEEIEGGMIQKRAEEMFSWAKLRATVKTITKDYRPKFYNLGVLAAIIATAIQLALLITLFVIFMQIFTMTSLNVGQANRLVNLLHALSTSNAQQVMRLASTKGILYTKDEFDAVIKPEIAENESFSYVKYDNQEESLATWTEEAINIYLKIFRALADAASSGLDMSSLAFALRNDSIVMKKCVAQEIKSEDKTSPKDAFITQAWGQFVKTEAEYAALEKDAQFCEVMMLNELMPEVIQKVVTAITEQSLNDLKERGNTNTILLISYIVVFIVIICPLYVIILITTNRSNIKLLEALMTVDKADAEEAARPIRVDAENDKSYSNVAKYQGQYQCRFILARALFIVGALASFILPIVASVNATSAGTKLTSLLSISMDGFYRRALTSHMIGQLAYKRVAEKVVSDGLSPPGHFDTARISAHYENSTNWLISANRVFLYGTNNNGMLTQSTQIKNLHVVDNCGDKVSSTNHEFYSCLGLERALSTFILYANEFNEMQSGTTLKDEKFIEILHLENVHLNDLFLKSNTYTNAAIQESTSSGNSTIAGCLVSSIIGMILLISGLWIEVHYQTRIRKAMMAFIRHLPPPVVANSTEIIDALGLSNNRSENTVYDPLEVVFNTIASPVLCVGDNNIIEAVNKPFLTAYSATANEVVGRRLNALIMTPTGNETEMTVEEQGAYHLFEKMQMMQNHVEVQHCTYKVNMQVNDELPVAVNVTATPIEARNKNINFVVTVEDTRQLAAVESELEAMEKQAAILMNQLIPRTIASFVAGRERGFAFIAKKATVVAIRITSAFELVQNSFEPLEEIFNKVDSLANSNPPMMPLKTISDTMFYVGGLFSQVDDPVPAQSAMKLGLDTKAALDDLLPRGDERSRFTIAVLTGGPLLCGLVGSVQLSFEISGPLIDDAALLLESGAPDMVLVSEATRANAGEVNYDFEHAGPTFMGQPTYVL